MELLPRELKSHASPVVAVYGLDTSAVSNKILWELLNNSDRKSVIYVNLDDSQETIPQNKPERTSYEWYIPKGILKSKWLEKHLTILPSVAVCFADLDWSDPLWPDKKTAVVEKLQQLKTIIGTRSCKIALVLIQKGPPMPPGEDPIATERAGALCQACDLPAKYLFALPCHADHLHGYTMRLESAFLDMAQAHYLSEARRVKSHREQLNRTNHAYLFVRHAFKIAVYCDLRQDQGNALKHYLQSYDNLLQVRIVDNNINEVKTVAATIAYKIWKINFVQNQPREAIAHFKTHIDHFKTLIGPQELEFEHDAWLASQYDIFGSIFEEAIVNGLPAIQREHPGFYFQQAASHAQERKRLFKQSLSTGTMPSDMALLEVPLEFYGQRPWRPGKVSIEPPEPEKEAEGVAFLKFQEKMTVDHSKEIISLLNRAVENFESQKSPGLKRQLLSQVAKEHYESGNYHEAMGILHPLFWEFQCEGWWLVLTNLLQLGLKAAYKATMRSDYFTLGAALCCVHSLLPKEKKKRIFDNLMGILEGTAPAPEEGIQPSQSLTWGAYSCVATIALNTFASLIEIKAKFQKAEYTCDSEIVMEVFIKNLTAFPVALSKVAVALSSAKYADICQTSFENHLLLEPDEMKRLEFRIYAEPVDVGSGLFISSVSAFIGNLNGRYALIHCEGAQSEDFSPFNCAHEFAAARQPWNRKMSINEILPQPSVEIRPKVASVDVSLEHQSPALAGEWYPVKVNVRNREPNQIDALEIFVAAQFEKPTPDHEPIVVVSASAFDETTGSKEAVLTISNFEVEETRAADFYVKAPLASHVVLQVKVIYSVKIPKNETVLTCSCVGSQVVSLKVSEPFKATCEYKTVGFVPIVNLYAHEELLLMTQLIATSPHALLIEECLYKSPQLDVLSDLHSLSGVELGHEECASECWALKPNEKQAASASGEITVKWKRASSVLPFVCTVLHLPSLPIEHSSLAVNMELPAQGYIRQPLCAKITLRNLNSSYRQRLQVTMDSNDAFMFSGNKLINLTVEPLSAIILTYNLYPLLAGYVALPPFRLSPVPDDEDEEESDVAWTQDELNLILDRSIPSHIYVLPQSKRRDQTAPEG